MTDEQLRKALSKAWSLGQEYWRQADSDSYKQQDKSDVTRQSYLALVEETVAILQAATREAPHSELTDEALKMADSLESSANLYSEAAAEMDTENYESDDPVDIQAGLENQAATQISAAKMIRALIAASAPKV